MNDRVMPTPRSPFTEAFKAEMEETARTRNGGNKGETDRQADETGSTADRGEPA